MAIGMEKPLFTEQRLWQIVYFLTINFILSNLLSHFIRTKSYLMSTFFQNTLKFLPLAVTALLLASPKPLAVTKLLPASLKLFLTEIHFLRRNDKIE